VYEATVAKKLFSGYRFLESQCRQGFRSVDVCRYANFFPAFCIGSSRCLGLAGVLNSITAQQQMCRQTIAGGQTKDNLRDFGRIAVLSAPKRIKRLDQGPHRWLIVRENRGHVFVRTSAPVCSHPARFERAHPYAKSHHLLCQGFGQPSDCPLGSMLGGATVQPQATAE
jgi:hypothetical protein